MVFPSLAETQVPCASSHIKALEERLALTSVNEQKDIKSLREDLSSLKDQTRRRCARLGRSTSGRGAVSVRAEGTGTTDSLWRRVEEMQEKELAMTPALHPTIFSIGVSKAAQWDQLDEMRETLKDMTSLTDFRLRESHDRLASIRQQIKSVKANRNATKERLRKQILDRPSPLLIKLNVLEKARLHVKQRVESSIQQHFTLLTAQLQEIRKKREAAHDKLISRLESACDRTASTLRTSVA
eukprot:GHVN01098244.1.p1 GENE.GHVN01098244.1~~GHVN01098244.1.p1  ORF type:complete len:241 (+),score=56.62 GHVN01098244.1:72-794(+)